VQWGVVTGIAAVRNWHPALNTERWTPNSARQASARDRQDAAQGQGSGVPGVDSGGRSGKARGLADLRRRQRQRRVLEEDRVHRFSAVRDQTLLRRRRDSVAKRILSRDERPACEPEAIIQSRRIELMAESYEKWLNDVRAGLQSINMPFDDWQNIWHSLGVLQH